MGPCTHKDNLHGNSASAPVGTNEPPSFVATKKLNWSHSGHSTGGGLGTYRFVNGDFPECFSFRPQDQSQPGHSTGGGLGKYHFINGDVPDCFSSRQQARVRGEQHMVRCSVERKSGQSANEFVILQYNVHSLVKFEERIDLLMNEVGDLHWDLFAISETWRAERSEAWETVGGHSWLGSGGMERTRGVDFKI